MTTLRIAGFDLGGVHLGCACIDLAPDGTIRHVARATIQIGEVVPLPSPIARTRKDGSTWVQRQTRITGPDAFERAADEATAWGVALGAQTAAIEWIKDLHKGSHSPVLHAGQVGQALHGALRRAGVPVELYGRSNALALLRRLAVSLGAPVLPAVVRSRDAALGAVLDHVVEGWRESSPRAVTRRQREDEASDGEESMGSEGDARAIAGSVQAGEDDGTDAIPVLAIPTPSMRDAEVPAAGEVAGLAPDRLAASREDRRPEHEADACAVAVAHVARLAGVVVESHRAGAGTARADATPRDPATKRPRTPSPRGMGRGRRSADGCKACVKGSGAHRRECPKWTAPPVCEACAKGRRDFGKWHRRGCSRWRRWIPGDP